MGRVEEALDAMRAVLQKGPPAGKGDDVKRFCTLAEASLPFPRQQLPSSDQIQEALKSQPAYVPALMALATVCERDGKIDEAKALYQRLISTNALFAPAVRAAAILSARSFKNDPQGYTLAVKAREAYPDDPEVARALGILSYIRGSDDVRAIALLKESNQKRQNDPEILYYLGKAQLRQKQSTQGKDTLRRALELKLSEGLAADAKRTLAELN
jgi:Flp pilus assembly protein TadD